jgi:hypothetical protein
VTCQDLFPEESKLHSNTRISSKTFFPSFPVQFSVCVMFIKDVVRQGKWEVAVSSQQSRRFLSVFIHSWFVLFANRRDVGSFWMRKTTAYTLSMNFSSCCTCFFLLDTLVIVEMKIMMKVVVVVSLVVWLEIDVHV